MHCMFHGLTAVDVATHVQEELRIVRRLLRQCEEDREAEARRRQQTDERLLQVLEANRVLTAQLKRKQDSAAAQQQVNYRWFSGPDLAGGRLGAQLNNFNNCGWM